MLESDYILATAFARAEAAEQLLRDAGPGSILPKQLRQPLRDAIKAAYIFQQKLYQVLNIAPTEH